MPRDDDFGAAARELRESLPIALAVSVAGVLQNAARYSRILAAAESVVCAFRALPPAARLRQIGLAMAIAFGTHLLLGRLVPPHAAPLWLKLLH